MQCPKHTLGPRVMGALLRVRVRAPPSLQEEQQQSQGDVDRDRRLPRRVCRLPTVHLPTQQIHSQSLRPNRRIL